MHRAAALVCAGAAYLAMAPAASAAVVDCTPDAGFTACKRYTFSGGNQSFSVPAGVASIDVRMWAGGGGGYLGPAPSTGGGSGGFTQGTVAVNPGTTYTVVVGEGGKLTSTAAFGGGGAGGTGPFPGGGGGGYSGVFSGATATQAGAVLMAGGGAGSSSGMSSGLFGPGGGGTTGRENTVTIAYRDLPGGPLQLGGARGTQTAGGAAATYTGDGCATATTGLATAATAGSALTGGKGADNGEGGGGGGGGYFGGGGGRCQVAGPNGQNGPGGGGSGYIRGAGVSAATTTQGNDNSTAGTQPPPQAANSQYLAADGIGKGGGGGATLLDGVGGNGMVVIQYNAGATITLQKALGGMGRIGASDNFSVAIRTGGISGTVVSSTAAATTSGTGSSVDAGTGTSGDFHTVAGTTYTLTEAAAGGANLANYNATLTCADAAGVTPAESLPTSESFNPAIGRAITPVTGANLRCVITNSPGMSTVRGRVFLDNGQGGGTANDGILNGGEGPLASVTMRLTNCAGTVHATSQTDAAGGYSLGVPASVPAGAALCVEEDNPGSRMSTGASVDSTALPSGTATSVGGASYTYTRGDTPDRIAFNWNGTGHASLNFGDVDNSTFAASGAKTGLPGNTVTYPHTFSAGTGGQVRFSIAGKTATPAITGWSEEIYADVGCTGSLQPDAAQLYPPAGAATAVAFAGQVCIIVRQFIPATAPMGARNKVTVRADFDYANAAPALSASFTLEDETTVSAVALELKKEVRNVTQGGSFGINNQAKSGETLEYRITYTNNSDAPVRSMTVNDTTPSYTSFVSATAESTPATLTACMKSTPANALPAPAVACTDAQPVGGTGPIDWKFAGFVAPGGTGAVRFQVKVD